MTARTRVGRRRRTGKRWRRCGQSGGGGAGGRPVAAGRGRDSVGTAATAASVTGAVRCQEPCCARRTYVPLGGNVEVIGRRLRLRYGGILRFAISSDVRLEAWRTGLRPWSGVRWRGGCRHDRRHRRHRRRRTGDPGARSRMRADARRNRERLVQAARERFSQPAAARPPWRRSPRPPTSGSARSTGTSRAASTSSRRSTATTSTVSSPRRAAARDADPWEGLDPLARRLRPLRPVQAHVPHRTARGVREEPRPRAQPPGEDRQRRPVSSSPARRRPASPARDVDQRDLMQLVGGMCMSRDATLDAERAAAHAGARRPPGAADALRRRVRAHRTTTGNQMVIPR